MVYASRERRQGCRCGGQLGDRRTYGRSSLWLGIGQHYVGGPEPHVAVMLAIEQLRGSGAATEPDAVAVWKMRTDMKASSGSGVNSCRDSINAAK